MLDMREQIKDSLREFTDGDLTSDALNLFKTLGYESERRLPFENHSLANFEDFITDDSTFHRKNGLVEDWKYVDFLFQLTESELKDQNLLFDPDKAVDQRITSYLFFVIELREASYNRTKLSQITREVNKAFPIPAMVLFKYGEYLTLSIIDRQPHKRDESKDVLRKVTLIKDIRFADPHRAHIDNLNELSLAQLQKSSSISSFLDLHREWQKRLDVELVTGKFFRAYKTVFDKVEATVEKTITDSETARLFTQRLFNRLMFIYFVQKKGWMIFDGSTDYLRRIFEASEQGNENFFKDRLYWVFFFGLSNVGESTEIHDSQELEKLRGVVPYLNGGLFEMEKDGLDDKKAVSIPNSHFAEILNLFEKFNFTVEESTPLEVQVAIDPEILGRVFEELVTGRHESGSYYTPRQIVSFMCRESLKHYLAPHDTAATIAEFVDEGIGEKLSNPEKILEELKSIRVCDPACGSGAYLLGMMQELLRLREALFTSKNLGDSSHYNRKREIIENSIYGVDKDRFAVQIASLRLWLSLAIESEEPRALPNLKYKIGCGDSLLAPLETDIQQDLHRRALIEQFRLRKAEYSSAFDHQTKKQIENEIERLRRELAQAFNHLPEQPKPAQVILAENNVQPLRDKIGRLVKAGDKPQAEKFQKQLDKLVSDIERWKSELATDHYETPDYFDWSVEFAEVFEDGGFDVVLANPPYIRQELLGREYKENGLRPNFPEVYSGTADIYVYFFARADAMLKPDGVACFISSNKWLRAGYGEKLRQHLLDSKKFHLVVDFGELPVFNAATFPAIFLWQNAIRNGTTTSWAVVKDLQACYSDGVREHIKSLSESLPASQFGIGKSRLASAQSTDFRAILERTGVRLKEYVDGEIYRGILTGLNEAYIINRETRDRLIEEDKRSAEILKPMVGGDDVRRYETHFRESYLVWTYVGVDIDRYPAIFNHLKQFRVKAKNRTDQGNQWWELRHCAYYGIFTEPKIHYPEIAKESRFVLDSSGLFPNKTVFSIPLGDWFLLAVLNSSTIWKYLKSICSVLGDENASGRLTLQTIYLETLPIPNASDPERKKLAELSGETQNLHSKRRKMVERFLIEIGTEAATSTSKNVLEQPWTLTEGTFLTKTRSRYDISIFRDAKDATIALTEQISKIEREIDERVADLYGVKLVS